MSPRPRRARLPPEQLDWITPEGIDVKPVYAADRDAAVAEGYPLDSLPGAPAVCARAVSDDVCQPAVDHPVRGVLHGRRFQRVLPPQPGAGQKGLSVAFDLATALRLRPSARAG